MLLKCYTLVIKKKIYKYLMHPCTQKCVENPLANANCLNTVLNHN